MNRNLPEAKEGIESKRQSGIDHGVYGAKYIYDLSGKYGPNGRIVGELLANVICYHHGGLPDAEDFYGDSPLLMRLQGEIRLADYEQVKVTFFKDLQITETLQMTRKFWNYSTGIMRRPMRYCAKNMAIQKRIRKNLHCFPRRNSATAPSRIPWRAMRESRSAR